MRLEFINRVKENEILGKSILTCDGKILLRAGIKLTRNYLQRLIKLGVFYIYIEDHRLEDVEVEDEELSQLKQVAMKSMSNIIKNIHSCNGKELNKSLKTVEELISYVIEIGDINKSLSDIKTYDNYTYMHSLDTCIMTSFLGISSRFNEMELKQLGVGAILHDIGKTEISKSVLNKNGKLTEEEFSEMKKHTIYGGNMLRKNFRCPKSVIEIVEQHHERVDGKGYPYGLIGNSISKFARVVCICDVYDAVSNDRCYRKKFNPNDAYELILGGSGTSFDRKLVKKFKETFAIYPLGCRVKLSSGQEGYVVRQNKGFPDRPVVRMLDNEYMREDSLFYEINLIKNTNLVINDIV